MDDGFFYCTIDDLYKSTGKKYDAQTTAVKKLVDLGLIEYKVAGIPAKRYFRVVLKDIEVLINKGKELLGEVKEKIKNTIDNVAASISKEAAEESVPVKDESLKRAFTKKQLAIMVRKIKKPIKDRFTSVWASSHQRSPGRVPHTRYRP